MVGHRITALPERGPTESSAPEPCFVYFIWFYSHWFITLFYVIFTTIATSSMRCVLIEFLNDFLFTFILSILIDSIDIYFIYYLILSYIHNHRESILS